MIEPNVKLECVPKFCYLGDTLGAGGGVDSLWKRRQEPELNVLGLSSRSYLYLDCSGCIIPHKGKDIQSLCL